MAANGVSGLHLRYASGWPLMQLGLMTILLDEQMVAGRLQPTAAALSLPMMALGVAYDLDATKTQGRH